MWESLARVNAVVGGVVWGPVGLALLFGTGCLLTVRTGFFQLRYFGYWMRHTIGAIFLDRNVTAHTDDEAISQFQSLCTALAATIGTGNIVGVAAAILAGGPGAVFWMWVMALLVLLLSIPLLYKMRWGHYITTLGGNPVALRRCGVRTGAWRISTFAVMGFLAALAGIIISARLNSAEPNAGLNMEMDAITAVILGGTPLHGGSAALAGTAVAVLLLGTIRNGLTLMSVSSYYQQFITGAILLCAVVTAEIRERRRRLH